MATATAIPDHPLTPDAWRLIRHVGLDLLRVGKASDDGFILQTTDTNALISALLCVIQTDHDDGLKIQAGLLLARGGDLVPFKLVLPLLGQMLQTAGLAHPARNVLEMAAPRPGNEALTDQPSPAVESLERVALRFPEVADIARAIRERLAP